MPNNSNTTARNNKTKNTSAKKKALLNLRLNNVAALVYLRNRIIQPMLNALDDGIEGGKRMVRGKKNNNNNKPNKPNNNNKPNKPNKPNNKKKTNKNTNNN